MGRDVLGWERSEIGRGAKLFYGRKSTLSGNLIFAGVELGALPHGFRFWAWISLLEDRR